MKIASVVQVVTVDEIEVVIELIYINYSTVHSSRHLLVAVTTKVWMLAKPLEIFELQYHLLASRTPPISHLL